MDVQREQPTHSSSHLRNSTSPGPLIWCRAKTRALGTGPVSHFVLEPRWATYDVRGAYEDAQRKHDPLLSPHGFFSNLAYRNTAHAIEFLEKFGPLEGATNREERGPSTINPLKPPAEPLELYVHYFWRHHLEFCQIVSLWESLDSREALIASWRAIEERLIKWELTFADTRASLKIFPWEKTNEKGVVESRLWDGPSGREAFNVWVDNGFAALRSSTLDFIRTQLDFHTYGSKTTWEFGWEPSGIKFRPVMQPESLLQMIWEFFAHDTAQSFWRRCPHCQRLFYPKRRDQLYCVPRQQALASKRTYAAWRRAEEKKRRRRPRRTRKGAPR